MVGLSVVLEAQNGSVSKKTPQVINKATMMVTKTSSSSKISLCSAPAIPFLEQCFLCGRRLLPGKDIYMYKGDTAFCSVECRCRQIFMDEEETLRKEYCSFAAMTPASASSASSSSSSTSTTPASRHSKSTRSRADASAY